MDGTRTAQDPLAERSGEPSGTPIAEKGRAFAVDVRRGVRDAFPGIPHSRLIGAFSTAIRQ